MGSLSPLSPGDFARFADKLISRYSWVFEHAEADLKALAPADDGEHAEEVNTIVLHHDTREHESHESHDSVTVCVINT